jgi:transcriptional regulator with XRE-family HTH domain
VLKKFMLGTRLKEILKAEGISAYRLSKDLNIDQGQLSRYFNGKGSISIKKFERIIERLGYEITFNKKAIREEEEGVKAKAPAPKRIPMYRDHRDILRCSNCNTTFDRSSFGVRLTSERLPGIECPYCFKKGYVVVERRPTASEINVKKKKQVSRDKRERKTMELPFKDLTDKEEMKKLGDEV